jgi:predicted membrane protein
LTEKYRIFALKLKTITIMENQNKNGAPRVWRTGLGFSLLLLLIGFGLLAVNFGWFPEAFHRLLFSWPMLLIVIGLWSICCRKFIGGLVCTGIGIFFILPKLALCFPAQFPNFPPDFISRFWPVLLILAGVMLIISRFIPNNCNRGCKAQAQGSHQYFQDGKNREVHHESNFFYRSVVFGNGEYVLMNNLFTGGKISVSFGAITLDMRKSILPDEPVRLKIHNSFGGVVIIVPDTWNVSVQVNGICGGFKDNRIVKNMSTDGKLLIIEGECVFAGGELKD